MTRADGKECRCRRLLSALVPIVDGLMEFAVNGQEFILAAKVREGRLLLKDEIEAMVRAAKEAAEAAAKDSPCDQTTSGAQPVDTTNTKAVDAESPSHTTTAKSDRADAKDRSEPSAPPPVEPDRLWKDLARAIASGDDESNANDDSVLLWAHRMDMAGTALIGAHHHGQLPEQRRCAELEAIVREYRERHGRHAALGNWVSCTQPDGPRCHTCKKADALGATP